MTSFIPLWKLKGTQLAPKTPAVCLAHLQEESEEGDKEAESEDPDSIDRVIEEFMVHLAKAVKDAQVEENHCYHCSSLEHFICNCPLVRSSRANTQLNCKEGMALKKGAQAPQMKVTTPKPPRRQPPRCRMMHSDSLFESQSLSALAWCQKCSQGEYQ